MGPIDPVGLFFEKNPESPQYLPRLAPKFRQRSDDPKTFTRYWGTELYAKSWLSRNRGSSGTPRRPGSALQAKSSEALRLISRMRPDLRHHRGRRARPDWEPSTAQQRDWIDTRNGCP
jgi:hypothetical protein